MDALDYQLKSLSMITDAMFSTQTKKKTYEEDYSMFIGDAEFCCQGDYEKDDPSVGYKGQFTLFRVWVATDLSATDLTDFLSKKTIELLEEKGYEVMSEKATEEDADKAEYSRDMER